MPGIKNSRGLCIWQVASGWGWPTETIAESAANAASRQVVLENRSEQLDRASIKSHHSTASVSAAALESPPPLPPAATCRQRQLGTAAAWPTASATSTAPALHRSRIRRHRHRHHQRAPTVCALERCARACPLAWLQRSPPHQRPPQVHALSSLARTLTSPAHRQHSCHQPR
jgi:hypothetical protein